MPPFTDQTPKQSSASVFTWRFFVVWMLMTVIFLFLLYVVGLAPEGITQFGDTLLSPFNGSAPVAANATPNPSPVASSGQAPPVVIAVAQARTPKIIIPTIGVEKDIILPTSANIDVLNNDLLKGVVHYPGSALPDQGGNVFLFGHSTGLKVVHNKNFEAFNRIHELASGDIIRVQFGPREYWYRVTSVMVKRAEDALVDLRPDQSRKLTLSTCKIFGAKDDRFVVEADFMKSYPLQSADSAAGTSS